MWSPTSNRVYLLLLNNTSLSDSANVEHFSLKTKRRHFAPGSLIVSCNLNPSLTGCGDSMFLVKSQGSKGSTLNLSFGGLLNEFNKLEAL